MRKDKGRDKRALREGIGARLRVAIESADLTQSDVARQMGRGITTVSCWARGKTQPSLEDLAELCELTGSCSDWIIGVDGNGRSGPPNTQPHLREAERILTRIRGAFGDVDRLGKLLQASLDGREKG